MSHMSRSRAAQRHATAQVREDVAVVEAAEAEESEATRARISAARQAEKDRPRLTRADLEGATLIRTSSGWHRVVRINAQTVTVETPWSWTDRIAHDHIHEARKAD